jgi:hypothetical protein
MSTKQTHTSQEATSTFEMQNGGEKWANDIHGSTACLDVGVSLHVELILPVMANTSHIIA